MSTVAGGMRWPRMPRGAWFVDRTPEDRARRLAGWLLARYRATGATNLPTRDLLRYGPLRRGDRLDEGLRLLAAEGVLQVLRLGHRRWVQVDPIAMSRRAPPVPARSSPIVQGPDVAVRYLTMVRG